MRHSCRLLAEGDVFPVTLPDFSGRGQYLAGLYSQEASEPGSKTVYFRVASMEPSWAVAMAVDPQKTSVMLEVSTELLRRPLS